MAYHHKVIKLYDCGLERLKSTGQSAAYGTQLQAPIAPLGIEFGALTAIALVLSTASTAAKWWAAVPALIIIVVKIVVKTVEYFQNLRVRISTVRFQLEILVNLLPMDGPLVRCTYSQMAWSWHTAGPSVQLHTERRRQE